MSKTITVRNQAYEELKQMKGKDESFSRLFERLAEERRPVNALAAMRGSVEFRDKKQLLKEIADRRREKRL